MAAFTGLNVLEIADGFCSASLCGQLFAGLDAEVIKLEPPIGESLRHTRITAPDHTAYLFHLVKASKQSAELHGDAHAAHDELVKLIQWADVVFIQQSSGSIPESDLDPKTFCAQWPTKVL